MSSDVLISYDVTQSNSAGVSQFKPWWAWQPGRAILVKVSQVDMGFVAVS
jgi:hypothetical protein